MTSVAVAIVSWNSSKLIGRVLEALAQQSFRPTRILILDNNSSDRAETERIVLRYSSAEWIPLSKNIGFAAANNLAIQHCSDVEFIALLNPDAFPDSDWLERLMSAALLNPGYYSFASRLICYDNQQLLDGAGDKLSILGKPRRRGHGFSKEAVFLEFEPVFCPSAAAALYRVDSLIEVGGFDEDFFCYMEDTDLGFRLQLAGYPAAYVPDAVAYHVGSATTGGQHSDFSVYHGHRNMVWTFLKNMPGFLFWVLLPMHIFLNLTAIVFFVFRGQGGGDYKS